MDFNKFMGALRTAPPKQVYLLAGEEAYYVDRAKERLLELLFPGGQGQESGLVRMRGDPGLAELVGAIETVPFFSDRNVVLLEHTSLFRERKRHAKEGAGEDAAEEAEEEPPKEDPGLDRLIALLKDMPPASYVIFVTERKADKRRKLYKAVEKAGAVLEAEPLRAWKVNDWLQGKLQSMNKELDRGAMEYFLGAVGMMQQVSLGFLDRELDKLALYTESRVIRREEMAAVFSGLPEVSLFGLSDAISERSAKKALGLLRRQLREGIPLQLLIAILSRHVRQLWQARLLMAQGHRAKELGQPMGLNPYIAERIGKASQKFREEVLEAGLLALADADYRMKTGRAGPELLEHAVIQLCGAGAHGITR